MTTTGDSTSNDPGRPLVRLWRSIRIRLQRAPEGRTTPGPGITGDSLSDAIDRLADAAERVGGREPHVGRLYLRLFYHLLRWTSWDPKTVLQLRRSDIHLERERLGRVLAELGFQDSVASIWRYGAICSTQTSGVRLIPISRSLRRVLDAFFGPGGPWEVARRRWARETSLLNALLFPSPSHPDLAVDLWALRAWSGDAMGHVLGDTQGINLWSHPFRTCQVLRQFELQQLCDEIGGTAYRTLAYLQGRGMGRDGPPEPEDIYLFATYPDVSKKTLALWLRSSNPRYRNFAIKHLIPRLSTGDVGAAV